MHRPTRQHQHLLEKIARKEALSKRHTRKAGKRAKTWRKWAAAYAPLAQQENAS